MEPTPIESDSKLNSQKELCGIASKCPINEARHKFKTTSAYFPWIFVCCTFIWFRLANRSSDYMSHILTPCALAWREWIVWNRAMLPIWCAQPMVNVSDSPKWIMAALELSKTYYAAITVSIIFAWVLRTSRGWCRISHRSWAGTGRVKNESSSNRHDQGT